MLKLNVAGRGYYQNEVNPGGWVPAAAPLSMKRCDGDPMILLGEVHTGLLPHSASLPPDLCEQVLGFARGEPVRRYDRPISHLASPELLTGIDCPMRTSTGARVRAVGTVRHHATITGGRVAQGCAVTQVITSAADRRHPWTHYLARPGQIETIGKVTATDLVDGFLSGASAGSTLDLGAISNRAMDAVQTCRALDRVPPFRAARTRLRWAASLGEPTIAFEVDRHQLRTIRISCDAGQLASVAELCEDLALHDWLLVTLLRLVERSQIGLESPDRVVLRLRPAIDHLLHLWMPAARVHEDLLGFWQSVELRPGFTRQWQATVDRIRDQVAIGTLMLLGAGAQPAR